MVAIHPVGNLRGHRGHGGSIRVGRVAGIALEHVGLVAQLLLGGR